jgi:hypothetical protein
MPILTLQAQQTVTQIGRIRLGIKVKDANGKERPTKLDRLRFTSPQKKHIETIARLYGGEVRLWEPPHGNAQWEVITDAVEVPVLVPPQDPGENQWFEDWAKGGCKRRCDGITEKLSQKPCMCDPDPKRRKCKMHTRITIMLKDVESIGVWLIDTSSFFAAIELPGVARLLASSKGLIEGVLRLDQRTKVSDNLTKHFAVPVLDVTGFTAAELVSGRAPELAKQRLAAAVDSAAAITAGPDPVALILACKSHDEIKALWKQFGADPNITRTPEMDAAVKEARANIDAAAEVDDEDGVIDAEIVEEPGW